MARNIQDFQIEYEDINGSSTPVVVDRYPDTCPGCKNGIQPIYICAHGEIYDDFGRGHLVQGVFKCPIKKCQAVFIAYYTSPQGMGTRHFDNYVYLKSTYIHPYTKSEKFDEEIEKLSPDFVKIYTQAKQADDNELDLICGLGYRKALEFLIKDYLILTKPEKEQYVKDNSLGWLIANDIESEKIKLTAGLAKDIGNDETHYEKKMKKLTVEDFKKLIKLTTHWISDEIATENYKNGA